MVRVVLVAAALAAEAAMARPVVVWGRTREVAKGSYARVHRLRDGRLMCGYERAGGCWVRFSADEGAHWSDERLVAAGFEVPAADGRQKVILANAEFVQLKSGRILFGVNFRPKDLRYDAYPYSIAVCISDDAGATWRPPKVVYRAEDRKDGVRRGCYEPFFLELPDGKVHLYFANEWPYVDGKRRHQEISLSESADGGETWSAPRCACYKPQCRDGMSVGIVEGDEILLAIETNGKGVHLHPEIVRTKLSAPWKTPVGFPSPDRIEPLAAPVDFRVKKGGAPYLIATATKRVLSWQQAVPTAESPEGFRTVHVAVAERGGTCERRFAGDFTPPDLDARQALWNSLCPLKGDSFLLVSEVAGKIVLSEGRIADDGTEGERSCRLDQDEPSFRLPRTIVD